MSEIQTGHRFWRQHVMLPEFFANRAGDVEDALDIPDHPALPAVARWLAEHGAEPLSLSVEDALNSHPYAPSHVDALRALLAALTAEGGDAEHS